MNVIKLNLSKSHIISKIEYYQNQKLFNKSLTPKNFSSQSKPINKLPKKENNLQKPIEEVHLFSHESAVKYYRINTLSLIGYNIILGISYSNPEYPDYLRTTIKASIICVSLILLGISILSKRHVSSLKLVKPTNILNINTFSSLGLFTGRKSYQIPLKDVKEIIPLSDYIKTRKTGIYLIKPIEGKKYFRFLNYFLIRPLNVNAHFDSVFKSKVRPKE